jgi:rSAM/selenodomain-associated transferase 2
VKISIIIPVINEEINLASTLEYLQFIRQQGHEIVVVDGGSKDNSFMLAQEGADIVIASKSGRAIQMNSGAEVASGDVFLFLHADTILPDSVLTLLEKIAQTEWYWGRFDVRLSSNKFVYRIIELLMNLRSRLSSIATGDQAIFISRSLFIKVGGFPEIALMEDIEISRRLRVIVKPICLKQKVITSSRRWETKGVIVTVLLMWKLRLYYFFGVSPNKLKQLYR